ncbi:MAG: hypothetical protein K2L28_04970 [Muribaculaceae bacterium]|nr:hypothetical protein [Muribaculaceae bacterium]
MKKFFTLAIAAATVLGANAELGRVLTQTDFELTNEWSCEEMVGNALNGRSGVGVNDKFYVARHGANKVDVYGSKGLETEITLPEGYHVWTAITADGAGNVIVRADAKKAFDGNPSVGNDSGFFVISSETDKIISEFIPMTHGYVFRYDLQGLVEGNIMEDDNIRLIDPLSASVNSYIFTYSKGGVQTTDPDTYAMNTAPSEDYTWATAAGKSASQTTTGIVMQYNDGANWAAYVNPQIAVTYSAENCYGNAIRKFDIEYNTVTNSQGVTKIKIKAATGSDYFYTPTHSNIQGFNIFSLAGKDYIIYPHAITEAGKACTPAADAFAIAEVSFVESPITDMTMAGESIANDKLAGTLVAVARPAVAESGAFQYVGNSATGCSYRVEAVEGDDKSVYIYAFGAGAPGNKWKFTVSKDNSGIESIEADTEAPAEYYNLQGIRVANPENGIFIRRQGAKATKVVL